jgi:hypothetical protein
MNTLCSRCLCGELLPFCNAHFRDLNSLCQVLDHPLAPSEGGALQARSRGEQGGGRMTRMGDSESKIASTFIYLC